jgi:hypothetical protein
MQFSQALRAPRRPPSRRDRGMTALIEGFFGFMWFGWGRANASSGLSVVLAVAVAGVGAAALAAAGQSDLHRPGAGVLLTLFGAFALAGVDVDTATLPAARR